jgi:hypothetical protein
MHPLGHGTKSRVIAKSDGWIDIVESGGKSGWVRTKKLSDGAVVSTFTKIVKVGPFAPDSRVGQPPHGRARIRIASMTENAARKRTLQRNADAIMSGAFGPCNIPNATIKSRPLATIPTMESQIDT